jgi:hypothetical protein
MKKVRLVILTMVLSGILLGCHNSKSLSSGWDYGNEFEQVSSGNLGKNDRYGKKFESVERKILFSAYLSLIVNQSDTTNVYIEQIAKKHEGYVSELGTNRTIIRVKSLYFDAAIKDISCLGKIESQNKKGQDVTEDFLDFQNKT